MDRDGDPGTRTKRSYEAMSSSAPVPMTDEKRYRGCSHVSAYKTVAKLGEGTFGEVYKARHNTTQQTVAMKLILMHNEKEGFPITALREIKIMKMLSHVNILQLSDMAVERGDKDNRRRGKIYMVSPYMDHDLSGLLENPNVHLSDPQIKCYMQQLLSGTQYLHEHRILHRDMKASNILIDNNGVLKIADFGLSRVFEEEPPAPGRLPLGRARRDYTNCVVTRWYRPPELLLGERRYTSAIDMWGVGCIFAEMYKTKPILPGKSDIDQLERILHLCGTASFDQMPGWDSFPGCEGIKVFKPRPRTLEQQFGMHGQQMVNLLSKMLELDPSKRFSAYEANGHAFFMTPPLAARPNELPKFDASHEIDKKRLRNVEGVSQVQPPAPAAGTVLNENVQRDERPDPWAPLINESRSAYARPAPSDYRGRGANPPPKRNQPSGSNRQPYASSTRAPKMGLRSFRPAGASEELEEGQL